MIEFIGRHAAALRRAGLIAASVTMALIWTSFGVFGDQRAAGAPPASLLGSATVEVHLATLLQKVDGLGGNYARGRDGAFAGSDKGGQDAVGRTTLAGLNPVCARVAIPLSALAPQEGGPYALSDKAVIASYLLLQDFNRRGIPVIASIFSVPDWAVSDPSDASGRKLAPAKYGDLIDVLVQYLLTGRDRYGISVDDISFNEPDAGNTVSLAPGELAAFIKQAGIRFAQFSVTSAWLVGDTSTGASLPAYAAALLSDPAVKPYLGPIAFQSWDCRTATDATYQAIAALGKSSSKPVWCTEVGYDLQLAGANPPVWGTWDHAMKLAEAYWRTFARAGASFADGWEYQDDYPLAGGASGDQPYPSYHVIDQLSGLLAPGAQLVETTSDNPALFSLATISSGGKQIGIILINTAGAGIVNLKGLPPHAKLSLVASGEDAQEKPEAAGRRASSQGDAAVPIMQNSVVTITTEPR
jgi:hypothetical protein